MFFLTAEYCNYSINQSSWETNYSDVYYVYQRRMDCGVGVGVLVCCNPFIKIINISGHSYGTIWITKER